MKLGIFIDDKKTSQFYVDACNDLGIEYELIDIMAYEWIKNIKKSKVQGFLVAPNSTNDVKKSMYEERLYFINKILNIPIYPSYEEVLVYENKRNMAYWLETHDIPKPKTWIFYKKNEALEFLNKRTQFPLVFKPNIGSGAIGIKFIKNRRKGIKLVNKIFTKFYFYNRGYTKWLNLKKKLKIPIKIPIMDDKQYNNMLFQEMIDVKYEWRGVKIGKSYFAHMKLPNEEGLHSGSGKADYSNPPIKVMEFIKYVCDISGFRSMNVDFFEDKNGDFYVNELQTIFGSNIQPYQMCVDGKPGRYLYKNNEWLFEEGMFNQNNSYNLRVLDFIEQLNNDLSE